MTEFSSSYHLVYLFERFPTFTQTFCVREILELESQGIRPLIFSLNDTREEATQSYPAELRDRVHYLPEKSELTAFVRRLRTERNLPKAADRTLRFWGNQPDKRRVYEAAYLDAKIRELAPNLHHAHCHFGGKAARTLWWLSHFRDFTYSFTAHANDVFCPETNTEVSMRRLMNDASRVVTVSDYTVRRLTADYPVVRHKVCRVYNGLDVAMWKSAAPDPPSGIGSRRIYSVGRLIEKKGYDDLVRASAILRERGIEHSCHIIGGGPLEGRLRAQIEEAGVQDTVFLEGEADQAEIIDALAHRCHLFALPCVTEADGGMDNLPTVIMEAMAVGLPCVSTRLAGVPEMVIPGETGLLVEERSPNDLADALQELLEDPEKSRKFGKNGARLAFEKFDKAVTASHLKRVLISGGKVRFDPNLLQSKPTLGCSYAHQGFRWLQSSFHNSRRFSPRRILNPSD